MEGATLVVTINRPDVLNALNAQVISDLDKVMDEISETAEIRGAILTGAGEKAFVAGADIAEINSLPDANAETLSIQGQDVFFKIERSPKPIVAAVNGFALGGGCELTMACHMRVATQTARFGQPEVNLGLIAGYGGTQRLVRLIGRSKATEYLLTGAHIKAEEAERIGLVNYVVNSNELLPKCLEVLSMIYSKSANAVGLTLQAIDAGVTDTQHGFTEEARLFGKAVCSTDGREGTLAFLEKRKPNFQ
ncbi:UNVERIFIED_CONTAM: hypothetical protein GTU68_052065 [Idotea baltica]|nr:hypothetical protein [Idotea baltica]